MDKRYIFLTILAVFVAAVILILPEKKRTNEIQPRELLLRMVEETRFLSTDEVAKMMIEEDPSLQLIDVRSPASYHAFSLPGAINIPLEKILSDSSLDIIGREEKTNVFFSNGTIHANQAWVLTARLGSLHNFVMKGGLNRWVETIMKPPIPPMTAPQEAQDLYQFRKGASQYFTGGTPTRTEEPVTPPLVPVTRNKKKASISGGC